VAVALVHRADGEQALGAVAPALADADEDASRERHAHLPNDADVVEPLPWRLRPRTAVGPTSMVVSSITPIEALTSASSYICSRVWSEGLACGSILSSIEVAVWTTLISLATATK
jgi:hypothetical protein